MQAFIEDITKSLVKHPWFEPLSNAILTAFYLAFLYNHISSIKAGIISPVTYVFIVMESTVILMLLFRKTPSGRLLDPIAWACAFIGTFAPLLLIPSPVSLLPNIGNLLMIVGGVMATLSYLSLNTSFGILPAIRNVRTNGLYKFVRHPVYLSYIVLYLGYITTSFSFYNGAIMIILIVFLLLRIHFEEKFLVTDEKYRTYKSEVRYRLLPGLY